MEELIKVLLSDKRFKPICEIFLCISSAIITKEIMENLFGLFFDKGVKIEISVIINFALNGYLLLVLFFFFLTMSCFFILKDFFLEIIFFFF